MSSEQACEKHAHRMPKVSYARIVLVGLVGPKPRAQAAGDGQPVYIPVPPDGRLSDGGTRRGRARRGDGDAVV